MSRANVAVVRAIYEAFNRRDWDAVFRDADPEKPPALRSSKFRVSGC
jgi:hypothetical protein